MTQKGPQRLRLEQYVQGADEAGILDMMTSLIRYRSAMEKASDLLTQAAVLVGAELKGHMAEAAGPEFASSSGYMLGQADTVTPGSSSIFMASVGVTRARTVRDSMVDIPDDPAPVDALVRYTPEGETKEAANQARRVENSAALAAQEAKAKAAADQMDEHYQGAVEEMKKIHGIPDPPAPVSGTSSGPSYAPTFGSGAGTAPPGGQGTDNPTDPGTGGRVEDPPRQGERPRDDGPGERPPGRPVPEVSVIGRPTIPDQTTPGLLPTAATNPDLVNPFPGAGGTGTGATPGGTAGGGAGVAGAIGLGAIGAGVGSVIAKGVGARIASGLSAGGAGRIGATSRTAGAPVTGRSGTAGAGGSRSAGAGAGARSAGSGVAGRGVAGRGAAGRGVAGSAAAGRGAGTAAGGRGAGVAQGAGAAGGRGAGVAKGAAAAGAARGAGAGAAGSKTAGAGGAGAGAGRGRSSKDRDRGTLWDGQAEDAEQWLDDDDAGDAVIS